jgi:hypothetical protein
MIKKKIILLMLKNDVTFKGIVSWFENNLNKSTHISLKFKFKTLNNPNGKCFQPNDYINSYKWNTIFFITTMFWILKLIN